jgi:hypothetical protein
MSLDFYGSTGQPVAYSDDGQHIYRYNGQPVAYLHRDAVYSFSGRQLGWFDHGCVRDTNGRCVLFTPSATTGLLKPVLAMKPMKGVKALLPLKGIRHLPLMKPLYSDSWSPIPPDQFFG